MHPHWYPGHMYKARKEINQTLKSVDVIIEVVDARLPYSSSNPFIANLRKQRPYLILMNKSDLADPSVTNSWQTYFSNNQLATHSISQNASFRDEVIRLCVQQAPHREGSFKPVQAMITGIPNVGKSSIINNLANRTIAKVGNEPAVTKRQQKIVIDKQMVLHDTPGILWPKFHNSHSGYRLAIAGSIRDTAIDYEDVAYYAIDYLSKHYPDALKQRYNLNSLPCDTVAIMEEVAKRRGAASKKGRVDFHKVSEIIVHDFRSKKIGSISLETPEMVIEELNKIKQLAEQQKEIGNP